MNEKVEQFFAKEQKWKEAFLLLRSIVSKVKSLEETYKWMHPCYTFEGKNVVLIHGFKDYCALLFLKGALMQDPHGILIQQSENVQAARQIRFADASQIKKLKPILKQYIEAALAIEQSGKKVAMKNVADYPVPIEFQKVLDTDEALNKAFYTLTPGRQKSYLFYFKQAKQSKTRLLRMEKYYQHILNGKGIDD